MDNSIRYYDQNANEFIESTFAADMTSLLERFTRYLAPGASILDIGCGSGRDSIWFMNQGFDVWAHDGSESMVKHCQAYLKDRVSLARFDDYQTDRKFDGLWASACLLHVPREALGKIINKYAQMLKVGGVFYMSFKLREHDHEKDGRRFTNMTRQQLKKLIDSSKYLTILEFIETADVRIDRQDEKWISVIASRVDR